jgi:hypothetical protein
LAEGSEAMKDEPTRLNSSARSRPEQKKLKPQTLRKAQNTYRS